MRYIWQHIKAIIETYDGSLPLAHYLKSYFKQYPILGSRDRKALSAMAYSWYRCRRSFGFASRNERDGQDDTVQIEALIHACMKICGNEKLLPPDASGTESREMAFDLDALFPFDLALSGGIDKQDWLRSMLV